MRFFGIYTTDLGSNHRIPMLLSVVLYYLAVNSAYAFPIEASSKEPTSSSYGGPGGCRSTSTIVWSCLTTIFLCTWVAIHPSIPYPIDQEHTGFWEKQRCMIRYILSYGLPMFMLALFFPEYILGFAIRQRMIVTRIQQEAKDDHSLNLTRTHGFFIIMGGFHYFKRSDGPEVPDIPCHPLHKTTVLKLLESKEIEQPTEAEIQDRSKSDSISKALVLIQTGWFILQCLARWAEHLPLTQLEITTLAYTAMTLWIYLAWWDKPRNVGRPIRVYNENAHICEQGPEFKVSNVLIAMFHGGQVDREALERMRKVPALYSGDSNQGDIIQSGMIGVIMGIFFGAIHCLAWLFEFPSKAELILWRISSLAVAGLLVLLFLFFCIRWVLGLKPKIIINIMLPWTVLYAAARITQLVLAFTTLRFLPLEAYSEVSWPTFIPHITA